MEGLCLHVMKAISIRDNKRLAINTSLFHPRQEIMVVRILDLPHAPLVECAGTIMHVEDSAEGITMDLHLDGAGTLETWTLKQVMTRRVPTFARRFPQKQRRYELELDASGLCSANSDQDPFEESLAICPSERDDTGTDDAGKPSRLQSVSSGCESGHDIS
jgi:hypothetical protein